MRWDNLFDDLESQLEQGISAEEIDFQAEEERLRLGRLTIRDRILALAAEPDPVVPVILTDHSQLRVRVAAIGKDWMSGELPAEPGSPGCIVPLHAVAGLVLDRSGIRQSLSGSASRSSGSLAARLGMSFVLRDLCRRRKALSLRMTGPVGTAPFQLHGTIDRVGADHLDLAVHDAGVPRRESEVRCYRTVRFRDVLLAELPS